MKNLLSNFRLTGLLLPLSFAFIMAGCSDKDDDVTPPDNTPTGTVYPDSLAGELNMQFVHTVDGQPLFFETQHYVNPAGDSFKVVELKYYISNLKLKNSSNGQTFALPNSYYLLNPKADKNNFALKGIPVKDYDQLEFSVGVDAAANASTARTGDLDPTNEMAWDWNTGYKFLVFSGNRVSQISNLNNQGLVFHMGENKNYRTLNFPLTQTLNFRKNQPYIVQIGVNLNELFKNPDLIDFDVVKNVMGGSNAEKLANNYGTGMFSIQQIAH
jgi:hypothetical protein